MSDHVYFDSSAILRWAFCEAGSTATRDVAGHAVVEGLLSSDAVLSLSPVTLIEVLTNFNQKIRVTSGWFANFDDATAEQVVAKFMAHLRSGGRITTRNLGARAYETALMWVGESIRDPNARLLQAWDAVHLYEAVRWSRELGSGVTVSLATADSDFAAFLAVLPELGVLVTTLDVCASA